MKMRTSYWLIIVVAVISVLATQKSSPPEGTAFYKGLTVGSTRSEVLAALGEPDNKLQHGDNVTWYYGKGAEHRDPAGYPEVWFDKNGKLASIEHVPSVKIGESVVIKIGDRQKDVFAKLGKPDVLTDLSKGSTYHVFAEFRRHELSLGFYGEKELGLIIIGSRKDSD